MNLTLPPFDSPPAPSTEALNSLPKQIWRRRHFFGLIFSLTLLPVLAVTLFWPPAYYTSGAVIIGNQEPASSSTPAAWIEKLGDPADLESQLIIVQSRRMLRLALARPGVIDAVLEECQHRSGLAYILKRRVDCSNLQPDSEELLEYVEARYSVSAAGRSRIISIGYRSPVPEVAFILANALLVTYLEDQRGEDARAREATAAWVLTQAKKRKDAQAPQTRGPDDAATQAREKFYQDLYNKASDLETERRVLVSSGRLVSLAEVPRVPYFPKTLPLLAAGLTIAGILATFVTLRRDAADHTVRRALDLEVQTKARVLALLPLVKPVAGSAVKTRLFRPLRWLRSTRNRSSYAEAITATRTNPLVAEAARSLYARLLLEGDHKPKQCILIASAMPGEGKTFTAIAIARAAVESGRKVLLIGCNLSNRESATRAGTPPEGGLAAVLRGEVEAQEAIVHTQIPGLDVIEAGAVRGCSTFLFIDGHLAKLKGLAEHYDLVLLDGPAAGTLPDAGALARQADGVLWCTRWGHTSQSDVIGALEDLHKHGVTLLGFVITMMCPRESRHYERPRLLHPPYADGV